MRITNLGVEPDAPNGPIIPYYMRNGDTPPNEPWCYNNITKWGTYASIDAAAENNDPFKMSTNNIVPRA